MSENLVTVKTILDFSETEREFKKLLNRLNSESAIKVKIDSPDVSSIDSLLNKFTELNTSIKGIQNLKELSENAGRNICLSAL